MPPVTASNESLSDNRVPYRPLTYSLKALTGEELVKSCQAGEPVALEELMRRYKGNILNRAYRLTRNWDEAEDVAAGTYLCICKGIGTCKHTSALPAWINLIVRNVWLNSLRSNGRFLEVSLDLLENVSLESESDFHGNVPLHMQVERNERKRIIASAIAALPRSQGQVVKLYYSEEQTYEEITEIMGIPLGTVKSRLSRAKYALLRRLTPHMNALMD
jgi:RNA polymerase sigma-70 factor (ECF subfamily)